MIEAIEVMEVAAGVGVVQREDAVTYAFVEVQGMHPLWEHESIDLARNGSPASFQVQNLHPDWERQPVDRSTDLHAVTEDQALHGVWENTSPEVAPATPLRQVGRDSPTLRVHRHTFPVRQRGIHVHPDDLLHVHLQLEQKGDHVRSRHTCRQPAVQRERLCDCRGNLQVWEARLVDDEVTALVVPVWLRQCLRKAQTAADVPFVEPLPGGGAPMCTLGQQAVEERAPQPVLYERIGTAAGGAKGVDARAEPRRAREEEAKDELGDPSARGDGVDSGGQGCERADVEDADLLLRLLRRSSGSDDGSGVAAAAFTDDVNARCAERGYRDVCGPTGTVRSIFPIHRCA